MPARCPSFDPNVSFRSICEKDWKMLNDDQPSAREPRRRRLPRSTFKIVTCARRPAQRASAAPLQLPRRHPYGDHYFKCWIA